ncbi:MAG: HAD-IIB family hydrolase [Candidatus Cloacimonetes bacterium]|nr:HAD-IIB family hydrolase [Candidatus Cloacimonadota bacterium]
MIKHIYLDFDGTLTNKNGEVADQNLLALSKIEGIWLRVIATGRTVNSFLTKVGAEFPIDYLIFSTGAGIMDWKTKEVIYASSFDTVETKEIVDLLLSLNVSFSIHHKIPHNHQFEYFQGKENIADFIRYIEINKSNATIYRNGIGKSTQFLIITDNADFPLERFNSIKAFANIVKISSPIDHKTTWIEILPKNVSKSSGAMKLCELIRLEPKYKIAVGNDFNDIDLLDWADEGYIVSNASNEILKDYAILENTDFKGVSNLIKQIN